MPADGLVSIPCDSCGDLLPEKITTVTLVVLIVAGGKVLCPRCEKICEESRSMQVYKELLKISREG